MKSIQVFLVSCLLISVAACQQTKPVGEGFSELALKGKAVFEAKECNRCHYIGDDAVQASAPDLTDPFIANDSSFIQNHLRFIELSKMPRVELSREEIRLVSHYIAQIHRNKFSTVIDADADERCPVCYAPVSTQQAKAAKLVLKWDGQPYHFECEKCKETFKLAPEAILMILQSESRNDSNITQK